MTAMICPDCGFTNPVGALLCANCGADLYDSLLERVVTRQLTSLETAELKEYDDSILSARPIVLYISREVAPISLERRADLVLGRNEGNVMADVDFTSYGAQDKGVSRHHARLNGIGTPPTLMDLDSYNGTFINGERLTPGRSYTLKSSDEIRLARLTLRIYFK
jgi:pSer/pThr/pTyr-binding forkhead associated (FHA) protein